MTRIYDNRAAFDGETGVEERPCDEPIVPKSCRGDVPALLVSVRDRNEIALAVASGVDIVDLKEPRRGALAPVDVDLWSYAASLWSPGSSLRLSAALGERSDAVRIAAQLPSEFSFAKVGPRGCDCLTQLGDLWVEVKEELDDRVELVAVAYADFREAECQHPESIFAAAIEAGFRRCLIDTCIKDGRSTLDHLGFDGLRRLDRIAREGHLWWAMAGSLDHRCVSPLRNRDIRPNCFGVRGDVCDRGRTGILLPDRIETWKEALKRHSD